MKRILLGSLMLLWLTACQNYGSYTRTKPGNHLYTLRETYAADIKTGQPLYAVIAGRCIFGVGTYGEGVVVRRYGRTLVIPANALGPEPDGLPAYLAKLPAIGGPVGADYAAEQGGGGGGGSSGEHQLQVGPRGGVFYENSNGNKTYVTPESTIEREQIQTGPRGGRSYRNNNGHKTYIKK